MYLTLNNVKIEIEKFTFLYSCCDLTSHPHTSQLLLLRQPDIVISDIGSIKQAGRARPLATAGQRLIMRPANKNKYLQEAVTRVLTQHSAATTHTSGRVFRI